MAYPLMDLRLDGGHRAAVRRWRAQAGRFYLLGTGVAALFVTDAIYGWLLLTANGYTPGSGPLEAGWALFYILLGAAALHPSMRTVSDRAARGRHDGQHRSIGVPRRGVSARARDPGGRGGARTAGRSRRRLERHHRAVHPRGRPHGRAGAPAGAVHVARAGAARGRVGARHRHGPRADLRGHAPGGADGGRRALRRTVPGSRGGTAARRRGGGRPRRRRYDRRLYRPRVVQACASGGGPAVPPVDRADRFIARSWGSPRRKAPCSSRRCWSGTTSTP